MKKDKNFYMDKENGILISKQWCFEGKRGLRKDGVQYPYQEWQRDEIIKCSNDLVYWCNKYVKVLSLDKGIVPFKLYDYQKKIFEIVNYNRNSIFMIPRQAGKSTTIEAYLLHTMIFNNNKTIGVVAHKEKNAIKIIDDIKNMFHQLPFWMQQGIVSFQKKEVNLENGSKLICDATSKYSLSGYPINILYFDEAALVNSSIIDEFMCAIAPTLASSTTSKIIITSTPKGYNYFAKMWIEAERGINEYAHFTIKWNEVPGRDDTFRDSIVKKYGMLHWKQEYECSIEASGLTLIEGSKLANYKHQIPLKELYQGNLKIYERPNNKNKYVMTVDVSEGVGADYSTFTVFDCSVKPYKPIMTYRNNMIAYRMYPTLINEVVKMFNPDNLCIVVENNSVGDTVVQELNWGVDCPATLYSEEQKLGVKTTKKTKKIGIKTLKDYLEYDKLDLIDYNTIEEFFHFIRNGETYKAEEGTNDDLVMNYVLFGYFLTTPYFQSYIVDVADEEESEELSLKKQHMWWVENQNLTQEIPGSFIISHGEANYDYEFNNYS